MTAVAREDIQPLNLTVALKAYALHVALMTDAEFVVEQARIEATPYGLVHAVVDDNARSRDLRALVAAKAPPVKWGCSA